MGGGVYIPSSIVLIARLAACADVEAAMAVIWCYCNPQTYPPQLSSPHYYHHQGRSLVRSQMASDGLVLTPLVFGVLLDLDVVLFGAIADWVFACQISIASTPSRSSRLVRDLFLANFDWVEQIAC